MFEDESSEDTSVAIFNTSANTNSSYTELDETANSMIERVETGGFSCKMCGKLEPKSKRDLRNHIEAKHIDGISIPCSQCGKYFRSRNSLTTHVSQLKVKLYFLHHQDSFF